MTQEELKQFISQLTWSPIGSGSFNRVIVSTEYAKIGSFFGQFVIKYPHAEEDHESKELSKPSRGARKFTTINPHYPVFYIDGYRLRLYFEGIPTDNDIQEEIVYVYLNQKTLEAAMINQDSLLQRIPLNHLNNHQNITISFTRLAQLSETIPHHKLHLELIHEHGIFEALHLTREGLLLPYFGKKQANRMQIAHAVLDIYQRTKNIIMDAPEPGNFLVCGNQTILVDPDQAYNRNSPVSLAFFNDPEIKTICEEYFQTMNAKSNGENPVVAIIKTLLYLESQLMQPKLGPLNHDLKTQDIIANDYVSYDIIMVLHAFRKNNWSLDIATLETLAFITDRCKSQNLTLICPEITPAFINEVQQALLDSHKPTTDFIRQQLLSELKIAHAATKKSTSKTSKASQSSNISKAYTLSNTQKFAVQTISSTQSTDDIDIYHNVLSDLLDDPLFLSSSPTTNGHHLPTFTSSNVTKQNHTTPLYQPKPVAAPRSLKMSNNLRHPESPKTRTQKQTITDAVAPKNERLVKQEHAHEANLNSIEKNHEIKTETQTHSSQILEDQVYLSLFNETWLQDFLAETPDFLWDMTIPPQPNTNTFSYNADSTHTKPTSTPIEQPITQHQSHQVRFSMFNSPSHKTDPTKITHEQYMDDLDKEIPIEDQHASKKTKSFL